MFQSMLLLFNELIIVFILHPILMLYTSIMQHHELRTVGTRTRVTSIWGNFILFLPFFATFQHKTTVSYLFINRNYCSTWVDTKINGGHEDKRFLE